MTAMTHGYLRHFERCNRHDAASLIPLVVAGKAVGSMQRQHADWVIGEGSDFLWRDGVIVLNPDLTNFHDRTAAFDRASKTLASRLRRKLRKEMYPLLAEWGDPALAQIDRRAVPWFGCRAFGVHINGYVRKADGIYMWIGERAGSRGIDPGKLDNMVGGGQPIGLSFMQNVCKEAEEEAGIPYAVALQAVYVSSLRYKMQREEGLRNDTLVIFDLELPEDFVPKNTDGEVAAFHLWPVAEVAHIVTTSDRFKFNCNLVIADFLLRHGLLQNCPERNALEKIIPEKTPLDIMYVSV